jgi:hypothetical protein
MVIWKAAGSFGFAAFSFAAMSLRQFAMAGDIVEFRFSGKE